MGYKYLLRTISKAMQSGNAASGAKASGAGGAKMQVYAAVNGQQAGPFTKTELEKLIKNGLLQAGTLVWEAGLPNWVPAATLPHVNKLLLLNTLPRRGPEAEPEAPHPLRADLIAALGQLGFRGADTAKAVDALLAARPDISSGEAVKQLLRELS